MVDFIACHNCFIHHPDDDEVSGSEHEIGGSDGGSTMPPFDTVSEVATTTVAEDEAEPEDEPVNNSITLTYGRNARSVQIDLHGVKTLGQFRGKCQTATNLNGADFRFTVDGTEVHQKNAVHIKTIGIKAGMTITATLRGQGGVKGVKKTEVKKNESTMLRACMVEKSKNVKAGSDVAPHIKELSDLVRLAVEKADASGVEGLRFLINNCSTEAFLSEAMDATDRKKSKTNSVDVRVHKFASCILGEKMKQLKEQKLNIDHCIDTCGTTVHYIFTKACSEIENFDLSSVRSMVDRRKSFLAGQTATSSNAGASVDEITTALRDATMSG